MVKNGMADDANKKEIYCSFCGKPQDQARRLVAGPGVYICDECIRLCAGMLDGEFSDEEGRTSPKRTGVQTVA